MKKKTPSPSACPCGSGKTYKACCALYLECIEAAPTAELLMRSRYTAYTRCDADYLLRSWHSSTRPETLSFDSDAEPQWIWLKVEKHMPNGDQATVEFVAAYKIAGRAHRLHETSRFLREKGQWYYVNGDIH